MLYRQFKGEEEDSTDHSEDKEGGIPVSRLEELLAKCDGGGDAAVELNEEEKKAFGEFIRKNAKTEVNLWEPWWNTRKEFATTKVQELEDL